MSKARKGWREGLHRVYVDKGREKVAMEGGVIVLSA